MTTIREACLAALALGLLGGCSQGAEPSTFGPPPFGPSPGSAADAGRATLGDDTDDGPPGGCCVEQAGPGCDDARVESCVCMQAPSCCTSQWTSDCAARVDELGCGSCGGAPPETSVGDPDDTGPAPGDEGDCCVGGTAPGCLDDAVEACVCTEIPFCCDTGWEEVCASAVEALGCGHCDGPAGTGESGDGPPPGESGDEPPTGGCCEILATPGCDDPVVQGCVCAEDPYCCDTAWDDVCVGEVDTFGCGDCGGTLPPPVSTCCSAQLGPGCDDPFIADCVCFIDEYCCSGQWDAACAAFVELFMCGSCR